MDLATLSTLAEQLAPLVLQKIKGKGKKEVSELTTVNDYENVRSMPAWYWNKQTGEKKAVNVSMADFQQHVQDVANQNLVEIKQQAVEANTAAQNSAESAAASATSAKNSEDYALAQKNETIDYLNTVRDNENERISNENERKTNEDTRKSNEIARANQENTRIANENERKQNETARQSAETSRAEAETTREENEQSRIVTESERQDAETTRDENEATRIENESARGQNEAARQEAETLRENSESGRANSETERELAEQARISAEETRIANEEERTTWFTNIKSSVSDWFSTTKLDWTSWFEGVKSLWSSLKTEVIEATDSAVDAADNANNMANHPPYVGEDLYWYVWNNTTKTYDKTDKYSKGDGFSIKMTFASISEMEAYDNSSVVLELGDFVLISSDVEDEDNSKLYVVQSVTSSKISYGFLTDMSGARGFTGHTPQLSVGTITTGAAGTLANVSLAENGTDANGNPKYLINFVIPKGDKGDKGDAFTYDDFTEEQIAGLQKPAIEAAAIANAAADNANSKASLANNAATNANEKASLAETAAANANEKAELANTAATNANDKATLANTAASTANTAADNANAAAEAANTAVDNLSWDNLSGKPSTFTPSAHNHAIGDITNLQTTLDGKADASHTHSYLPLSGGTMTGALNFKNGTWNLMGDDAYIGDCDVAGMIGVKGANAATPGFALYNNSGTLLGKLFAVENTLVWDGVTIQTTDFKGNASSASYVKSAPFNDEMEGTVATYKTYIHNALSNKIGIGEHVDVSDSIIEQWGNDSASYHPYTYSSIIRINGKYNGVGYGQYLVASWIKGLGLLKYSNGFEDIQWYATRDSCLSLSGGTISGNLTVTGTITYGSLAQGSDIRKKNIINNTMLLIDDIANAPLFTYTYKDNEQDKRIHSGTSAQYWEGVNSGLFTTIMEDGTYGLMSSELSLCAVISIAKQFKEYKEQTDRKIEELKNEVSELRELVNKIISNN